MRIADTSAILVSLDATDPAHEAVKNVLESERGDLVIPELVIAEVDYLCMRDLGRDAEEALLADVLEVAGAASH